MEKEPAVSVLIPAYNEAGRIGDTLEAVLSIPEVAEVVVVDDGSTDATAEIARACGARVISLERNRGKGEALNRGVPLCTRDVILLIDADLGASAVQARKLLLPILEDEADMTVACFPAARRRGGFGLVKGLARAGIRWYTGLVMDAPLSGQRALKREVLQHLLPFASGFGVEVGMTIKAARLGFRVREIPVVMTHRETGRDLKGFIHRGKQFWHVARVLWQARG
ncbi:glycosyltransferase family 2 protein [Desulfofundulus thermocisternus]|jgi:glycosyltransferase involved in cell wall biosynthesis|uniref:glycosyltransferase family 2 protein n=1 Tax=Desulfofundulus thermocisternus TaxID=42471 RepID=UPI00048A28C5|nr:glycosyltransferase family 2 protein [Desulfofundulus thermocisternus]